MKQTLRQSGLSAAAKRKHLWRSSYIPESPLFIFNLFPRFNQGSPRKTDNKTPLENAFVVTQPVQ
jgi:hypothetical protein